MSSWIAILVILQSLIGYHVPNHYIARPRGTQWTLVNSEGNKITAVTDKEGFRSIRAIDYSHKSRPRIFAIGGSTTAMDYLKNEDIWSSELEKILQNEKGFTSDVINAGVSGLRVVHHLASLRYVQKFQPDAFIFMLGGNDWGRDIKKRWSKPSDQAELFAFAERTTDKYILKYSPIGILLSGLKPTSVADPNTQPTAQPSSESKENTSRKKPPERVKVISWTPDSVSEDYRRDLDRLVKTCKTEKLNCLFVDQANAYSLKAQPELIEKFWMNPPPAADYQITLESSVHIAKVYNEFLREVIQRENLDFCKVTDQLSPTLDYFEDELHFTKKANDIIARLIAECVSEKILPKIRNTNRVSSHP